jgi:hypothetical protein
MGEKPPIKDKTVTHTICPECRKKMKEKKEKDKGGA